MSAINRQAVVSFLLLCLFSIRSNSGTNMTSLVLTQDGQPAATILLATSPTRSAQFAAAELQYHLRKISGATILIVSNEAQIVGTRILVGASKATKSLGLNAGIFQSQEYLVGFRTNTLILMGKDKPDTSLVNYDNSGSFPALFDEQGTSYAVYDFLERCCNVRWYLPTELGLVCPSNRTLKVSGVDIRRSPVMKYRYARPEFSFPRDLCGTTVRGPTPTPRLDGRAQALWWRRQRIGGEPYAANHSLYGYYNRFLQTNNSALFEGEHREYFASGGSAKRPAQMCYSNPGLISQVVQDANAYFEGKGVKSGAHAGGDYFAVVPMDNGSWCKCPDCADKVLPTSVRAKGQFSNDIASDYLFHFVNQIARQVYKTHPDKFIAALAYAGFAYPPSREKLEPNISIQLCLHARNVFASGTQDNDRKILDFWVKESRDRRKFLWLYYCFPSMTANQQNFRCFPGFFGHHIVKQMATWHKAGIRGMSYEPSYLQKSQRSALFDQVESYVTWKLADDPTLDGNQLIEEFFTRYYGAAAQPMKAFYNQVEDIYCNPTNYLGPRMTPEQTAWEKLGTAERMKELGGLMEQARAAASTTIEKKRVALFDKGVWQYMLAGRNAYLIKKVKKNKVMAAMSTLRVSRVVPPANNEWQKNDWPNWSKGALLGPWGTLAGEPTPRRLEGRLLHDGQFLYVQLEEMMDTTKLVMTGNIWQEDEWELFIGRERGKGYRQMGVNAQGVHQDLAYGEEKKGWDSQAKVVSDTSAPGRWVVRIAFPLKTLLPEGVQPGQTIYLNVIRSTDATVFKALSWIPTFAGFHESSCLGAIRLDEMVQKTPLLDNSLTMSFRTK